MHLLFSPVLANFYYIGGGSVGVLLIIALSVIVIGIVIKVLVSRRKRNLSSRYGRLYE